MDKMTPEIHTLVDQEHNFHVDEKIAIDRDAVDYAKSFEESKDRWAPNH